MKTAAVTLPNELLTLWPKLGPAYRLLQDWDHRGGIVFIGDGDQGLTAAREVAKALHGKTIELPVSGLRESDFNQAIGRYVDESVTAGAARAAGMDQPCIIVPRIDKQPKWLRNSLKGYCERGKRPLVLLLTCPDLDWMESWLKGHFHECRKKGTPKRTDGQRALKKLTKKSPEKQRSLLP